MTVPADYGVVTWEVDSRVRDAIVSIRDTSTFLDGLIAEDTITTEKLNNIEELLVPKLQDVATKIAQIQEIVPVEFERLAHEDQFMRGKMSKLMGNVTTRKSALDYQTKIATAATNAASTEKSTLDTTVSDLGGKVTRGIIEPQGIEGTITEGVNSINQAVVAFGEVQFTDPEGVAQAVSDFDRQIDSARMNLGSVTSLSNSLIDTTSQTVERALFDYLDFLNLRMEEGMRTPLLLAPGGETMPGLQEIVPLIQSIDGLLEDTIGNGLDARVSYLETKDQVNGMIMQLHSTLAGMESIILEDQIALVAEMEKLREKYLRFGALEGGLYFERLASFGTTEVTSYPAGLGDSIIELFSQAQDDISGYSPEDLQEPEDGLNLKVRFTQSLVYCHNMMINVDSISAAESRAIRNSYRMFNQAFRSLLEQDWQARYLKVSLALPYSGGKGGKGGKGGGEEGGRSQIEGLLNQYGVIIGRINDEIAQGYENIEDVQTFKNDTYNSIKDLYDMIRNEEGMTPEDMTTLVDTNQALRVALDGFDEAEMEFFMGKIGPVTYENRTVPSAAVDAGLTNLTELNTLINQYATSQGDLEQVLEQHFEIQFKLNALSRGMNGFHSLAIEKTSDYSQALAGMESDFSSAQDRLASVKLTAEGEVSHMGSVDDTMNTYFTTIQARIGDLEELQISPTGTMVPDHVNPFHLDYFESPALPPAHELWVRFYPDTIEVHTHEDDLTQDEIDDGRQYWTVIWDSEGDLDLDREAWQDLVNGYGPQRAAWITKELEPTNMGSRYPKIALPIGVTTGMGAPLTTDEITAGRQYWQDIWDAPGLSSNQADLITNEATAWSDLLSYGGGFTTNEALMIINLTRPINYYLKPHDFLGGAVPTGTSGPQPVAPVFPDAAQMEAISEQIFETQIIFDKYLSPVFPSKTPKDFSWTNAPMTNVMPDRFVVIAKTNSGTITWVGNPVTNDPLRVGMNPSAEEFTWDGNGNLIVPNDLKWSTHFNTAVAQGMGMKIPLDDFDENYKVDQLIVLGLKLTNSDNLTITANQSKTLLEELINNHHFSEEGFALVPQGTPTNNTEGATSGYNLMDFGESISYDVERGSALFSNTSNVLEKTDGQWLAEALGIDESVLHHIQHADGLDIRDGIAMNQALFQGTLGHYMERMMREIFMTNGSGEIRKIRDFFNEFVSARGFIPAVRVGNQPYGILPTTSFNRWVFNNHTTDWEYDPEFPTSPAIPDEEKWYFDLLGNLKGLENMFWKQWVGPNSYQVDYINKDVSTAADPVLESQRIFMNILGLNPGAVEFDQRYFGGGEHGWGSVHQLFADANPLGWLWNMFYGPNNIWSFMHLFNYFQNYTGYNLNNNPLPTVFGQYYDQETRTMTGPIIDSLPLSDNRGLEVFGDPLTSNDKNYIQRLLDSSAIRIRAEHYGNHDPANPNLSGKIKHNSLLYLLMRHSYLMQYLDTSIDLIDYHQPVGPYIISFPGNEVHMTLQISPIYNYTNIKVGDRIDIIGTNGMDMGNYVITSVTAPTGPFPIYWNVVANKVGGIHPPGPYYVYFQSGTSNYGQKIRQYMERLPDSALVNTSYGFNGAFHTIGANDILSEWKFMFQKINGYQDDTVSGLSTSTMMAPSVYLYNYVDSASPRYDGVLKYFREVRAAMQSMVNQPTAKLERAMADHLDLCSFRLDAWKDGLIHWRLRQQRASNPNGIFLGSYAWVEDLCPQPLQNATGNQIPDGYSTGELKFDPKNQGYIQAPSIPHAVTAAVLRSGYFANAKDETGAENAFSINLSSERVRKAVSFIEGVRNGQSLAALLGYQFERGLHDRSQAVTSGSQFNEYIYVFREVYPLVADADDTGSSNPSASVEALEANNVIDGLALLENARDVVADYPYGLPTGTGGIPPYSTTDPAEIEVRDVIIEEINRMQDSMDAVADLTVAESVYQVAQGNIDRSKAVMDAYSGGSNNPPDPEILKTPRTGTNLTNRISMLFNPVAVAPSGATIRAATEPSMNQWLSELLGDPSLIRCQVFIDDGTAGWNFLQEITLADLPIEPLDFLSLVNRELANDGQELTQFIAWHLKQSTSVEDDDNLEIRYTDRDLSWGTEIKSFMEMAPLFHYLENILAGCRHVNAEDFASPGAAPFDSTNPRKYDVTQLVNRIEAAYGDYTETSPTFGFLKLRDDIEAATDLIDLTGGGSASEADNLRDLLMDAFYYGVPGAIPQTVSDNSSEAQADLVLRSREVIKAMDKRIEEVTPLLIDAEETEGISAKVEGYLSAIKAVFGKTINVLPLFEFEDIDQINTAITNSPSMVTATTTDEYPVEDWLQNVAHVRSKTKDFENMLLMADNFNLIDDQTGLNWDSTLTPLQLPYDDSSGVTNYWLAIEFPDNPYEDDKLSMVVIHPNNALTNKEITTTYQCGILVDEWVEVIPDKTQNSAITFHYDQPNAKPPQSMLLAISPFEKGQWDWYEMVSIMEETLEGAKLRAVEPDHLYKGGLGRIVPTIIARVTQSGREISLDFGANTGATMYDPVIYNQTNVIDSHETNPLNHLTGNNNIYYPAEVSQALLKYRPPSFVANFQ